MHGAILTDYKTYLPPTLRELPWRTHPLDGKLLLFDRDTGLNVLLEGEETQHLRRIAPRTLLIAVTNACDLNCPFCYRDRTARSLWRFEDLLGFCQAADRWGVLEVAFGGGEPMLFPGWERFIRELYATTTLCLNFTTNGLSVTEDFLYHIAGCYGQIRLSLYEDNNWPETLECLVRCKARFGVNWLIEPSELPGMEAKFRRLLALGARDFLLLSYKGTDEQRHLNSTQRHALAEGVRRMYQLLGNTGQIKLDVCWGNRLSSVPRLFTNADCGAGDEFLSITSDKHVKACSFQTSSTGIPFATLADVRIIWERHRSARTAAKIRGCARIVDDGLCETEGNDAHHRLDAV